MRAAPPVDLRRDGGGALTTRCPIASPTTAPRRDARWQTLDAPLDLAGAIGGLAGPALIDCLTLWLSNVMLAERDVEAESERLLAALGSAPGPLVAVSNEVGLGLVPETPLGRAFRDAQGRLNQRVAAAADRVIFMAAGLPLSLK